MKNEIMIQVTGQSAKILVAPTMVSGSTGIYRAVFEFDDAWSGYVKTAVFQHDCGTPVEQLLDADNACTVPWECLQARKQLSVGVYGVAGDRLLPTRWASPMYIWSGAHPSEPAREPTPELAQQILGIIGNLNDLDTDAKENLVAAINEVRNTGGGGTGALSLGHALRWDEKGRLAVQIAEQAQQDNTLPITSAAVHTTVGNIEVLLQTI